MMAGIEASGIALHHPLYGDSGGFTTTNAQCSDTALLALVLQSMRQRH
jgi:hypothetical protein